MLKKIFFLTLLLSPVLGCSIYKSDGRNQMEAELPRRKAAATASAQQFELLDCKLQSRLETWLQEEFPKQNYTLVVSETDLEIWSSQQQNEIHVQVLQKNDEGTQSCHFRFANVSTWNHYQNQFIFEMRNNLLTAD